MKILLINGPNLNLLGIREKSIYGNSSFETYFLTLKNTFPDLYLEYYQSNIEGEIINKIHETGFDFDGIIINAGAYTHTSVAIRDAISGVKTPVIEVHISNVLTRESFRHESIIGPVCIGSIMGFGLDSYRLGIEALKQYVKSK
jgi:3-dehydroquinate dehydratase-2